MSAFVDWRSMGLLALVVFICAGCAVGDEPSPVSCTRDVVGECEVVGLVFADPATLEETLEVASAVDGITLAVYRTDYVCITDRLGHPDETQQDPSRFSYVEPDELRDRRFRAAGDLAPIITGGFIVQGFHDQMAEEWENAQQPAVLFDGAVVYVPVGAAEELAADDELAWVGAVGFELTPSLNRDVYPGELMVGADALDTVAAYPQPEPPSCD